MGSCIGTVELVKAGCTAKPGHTKMAPHEEQRARARARANSTAQRGANGGLDRAPRTPYLEQQQSGGGHRQLPVITDSCGGQSCGWSHGSLQGDIGQWLAYRGGETPGFPLRPIGVADSLTKVASAQGQEELGVITGLAGTCMQGRWSV